MDGQNFPTNYSVVVPGRLIVGNHHYLIDDRIHSALAQLGVTHIFDCLDEAEAMSLAANPGYVPPPDGVLVHAFRSSDDGKPRPDSYWRDVIETAHQALLDPDSMLYVHCWAGINRGPSVAYIIMRAVLEYSSNEAIREITLTRPEAELAYVVGAEEFVRRGR